MPAFIDTISPIVLPDGGELRRLSPRRPRRREPDYWHKFDYATLAYDVFETAGRDGVMVVSPPALNLEPQFAQAYTGAHPGGHVLSRLDRVERRLYPMDRWRRFNLPTLGLTFKVQPSRARLLAGKRVLFTLSRDNPLEWIEDWAKYYRAVHGVNAILFYDNASHTYTPADLVQRLRRVGGIDTIVVVSWPFRYGPLSPVGRKFDSNYCQLSMFEHARQRYLCRAEGVVNADIDELMVTNDGRTVFDHLGESTDGILIVGGDWVRVHSLPKRLPRFTDFSHIRPGSERSAPKWVISPPRIAPTDQWHIHRTETHREVNTSAVMLRHFRGISSDWKKEERGLEEPESGLVSDPFLRRDFARAF